MHAKLENMLMTNRSLSMLADRPEVSPCQYGKPLLFASALLSATSASPRFVSEMISGKRSRVTVD